MSCAEIQKAFTPYLDDDLEPPLRSVCDEHLGWCLVCRSRLAQMRAMTRGLSAIKRPAPPANLISSIHNALTIERAAQKANPFVPASEAVTRWLRPRLMPYTIGAFASVFLFVLIIGALGPRIKVLRDIENVARAAALEPPTSLYNDGVSPVQPISMRASEVPSLNPNGALAALVWASPQRGADDDDMIVVADVYSNGRASLAAIVQSPRNPRMISELENALRQTPAFVPASIDRRPENLRVVFVLQKVNVQERVY